MAHALAWLTQHPEGPFFIWVHLYDAHDPYDAPEPYKTRYAAAPYDGEIAYVDSAVGKLLQQLQARGLYDGAMIAVMADHGEALGAHGEDYARNFSLRRDDPCAAAVQTAGSTFGGNSRRYAAPGLVDVLPTILDATGIEIPHEVQGESLLIPLQTGWERRRLARDRPAYAESDYPHRTFGWSSLRSLRTGKYLFIEAPRKELYDQAADPKAQHNLSAYVGGRDQHAVGPTGSFPAKDEHHQGSSESCGQIPDCRND